MYHVKFWNDPDPKFDLPFASKSVLAVEDLERALALASMLQKVSTAKVPFAGIEVVPFIDQENEKK